MQVYRDEIIEKAVGPWLARGDQFVLEEDGDSGHDTGKKNIHYYVIELEPHPKKGTSMRLPR